MWRVLEIKIVVEHDKSILQLLIVLWEYKQSLSNRLEVSRTKMKFYWLSYVGIWNVLCFDIVVAL